MVNVCEDMPCIGSMNVGGASNANQSMESASE